MPFPPELLNDEEEIILDLRPHWWTFVGPVLFVIAVMAIGIALRDVHEILTYFLVALLFISVVSLLIHYLRWTTTNFVVTGERLIYRSGIIAKRGMEIPIERVTNIAFSQTIFERILDSGDLLIESAGESGHQVFYNLEHPQQVQQEIYRQMELNQERDAHRSSGNHELSIPEQIEKLAELLERGVISQAEFEAKKDQLLDRM